LRLKIEIFCKKKINTPTKYQNNFLFIGFGYKDNVQRGPNTVRVVQTQFDPFTRQTQAGMQVASAILFRVSLFNRVIIEKALSQITNMEASVQSLLSGSKFPVAPLLAGLVTLQLFQNCFPRISVEFPWYFSYVFSCLVL